MVAERPHKPGISCDILATDKTKIVKKKKKEGEKDEEEEEKEKEEEAKTKDIIIDNNIAVLQKNSDIKEGRRGDERIFKITVKKEIEMAGTINYLKMFMLPPSTYPEDPIDEK
jgi:hypothetical protein